MEYEKITNLLDTTFDNVPIFITKKLIEVHDQSGSAKDRYKPSKQTRSDSCDYSDAHIIIEGDITVTDPNNTAYDIN